MLRHVKLNFMKCFSISLKAPKFEPVCTTSIIFSILFIPGFDSSTGKQRFKYLCSGSGQATLLQIFVWLLSSKWMDEQLFHKVQGLLLGILVYDHIVVKYCRDHGTEVERRPYLEGKCH